ncbi:hypothetical protein SDRG_10859 [Saprolegnia diclina VS20]|uniref:ADP-dependent glucokinase n=1 Tax=Saprolegnia diclina (strain VS20) TaxID=1156394 RepID=T0QAJ1_SAPDV|nr:hypothetical protein SDRG_10859 [Saprolegnia diclina VS20]EQC31696.1 hypothetical protein SDRG_10859 [Saprolegnia diclina VS20]|eukprot:XP_008615095.1 hypothetical protein SDRG_10859 [Saprolegnia diclina VS20]
MYSASQLVALALAAGLCWVAVLYVDELSALVPSTPTTFSDAEHGLFLEAMEFLGTPLPARHRNRLAFCCSADLDVSVRAVDLMAKLTPAMTKTIAAKHHERIASTNELRESFGYYFSKGAAAEQSMSSADAFHDVVQLAKSLPGVTQAIGGNAAQMAQRAAYEASDVLLGGAVGDEMRGHFHKNVHVVGAVDEGGHEDVHLVLEYAKNDAFRNLLSPRANRYYLNHDVYNAQLSVLEEFAAALPSFDADLVVIGGLQLLEVDTNEARRVQRLQALANVLQAVPTLTHYEFAAASDFTLYDDTVKLVLPHVDSVGFNEQELAILHHFIVTGDELVTTSSRPSVQTVTTQLGDVIDYAARTKAGSPLHRLSRIHFHTLQFHILCHTEVWATPTVALMQSALMSSKLACGDRSHGPMSQDMTLEPSLVEVLLPRSTPLTKDVMWDIDPRSPIKTWTHGAFTCHIAPMLACKKPDHTCGLGDNISGTGMAYHEATAWTTK